jgi:L-asparaginase
LRALLPAGAPPFSVEKVYAGLSEAMGFADFARVAEAIGRACRDPEVAGVVVAHGTDTMEEAAYYADLLHDRSKPVVFTGAQRAAHAPDFDGTANLGDALALAGFAQARDHGVLIAFGGLILPAAQATKVHLAQTQGFAARDGNAGRIEGGDHLAPARCVSRRAWGPLARGPLGERVALITLSAGMSGKLIDAAVAAGYEGIVLAGLGSGNAPDAVVEAVGRALGAGVAVALGTRCLAGSVDGVYSSGHALVAAGALPLRELPAPRPASCWLRVWRTGSRRFRRCSRRREAGPYRSAGRPVVR